MTGWSPSHRTAQQARRARSPLARKVDKGNGCVGCAGGPVTARGLCASCYGKHLRRGDLHLFPVTRPQPVGARQRGEAEEAALLGIARDGLCACGRVATLAGKTLCRTCYERNRRRNPAQALTLEDAFFRRVRQPAEALACWVWSGLRMPSGYGRFHVGGRSGKVMAHRWSYEFLRHEIPVGLVIDHLCRNRACVNPWHMEPVTIGENSLRGFAPSMVIKRTGLCARGHSLEDALVVKSGLRKGARNCRTCAKLRRAGAYAYAS